MHTIHTYISTYMHQFTTASFHGMCMCICTHIHIHIHKTVCYIALRVYTRHHCVYTYTHTWDCMPHSWEIEVLVCVWIYIYIYIHTYIHTYMGNRGLCLCVCVYITQNRMYIAMHAYHTHILTYIHTWGPKATWKSRFVCFFFTYTQKRM
jgi:hypothetical protein